MKRWNVHSGAALITALVIVGSSAGVANAVDDSPAPDPAPAAEPEPEAPAEPAAEPEPTPEPEPEPEPTYAPGMAPGEHAGWVAVNPDGSRASGTMVCTPEVCGQTGPGSWLELAFGAGTNLRLVLESLQDPVEAATSPNGIGNVAGGWGQHYDFETGRWTMQGSDGKIYEVPLAYPGTDKGGNTAMPFLIYDPTDDDSVTDNSILISWVPPDERDEAEEAAFLESVRLALPDAAELTDSAGVVFTDAALERRTAIGANIANAVGVGSTSTGVSQAEKLVWLYTWAAVRALPADDRAEVTADLRTVAGDSALERQIRAQAKELALLDVAASLNLTPLSAAPDDRDACAVALTNAQGRIARGACALPTA